MIYTRIRTYYQDGKWTGCEQLYLGNNQVKAIERFRKEYPEHKECVVLAEPYNSDEHLDFKIWLQCGCVN